MFLYASFDFRCILFNVVKESYFLKKGTSDPLTPAPPSPTSLDSVIAHECVCASSGLTLHE